MMWKTRGKRVKKVPDAAFCLGLYTYSWQASLSIHRAMPSFWEDLIVFYDDKVPPKKVIDFIEETYIGAPFSEAIDEIGSSSWPKRLTMLTLRRRALTVEYLAAVCSRLSFLAELLAQHRQPGADDVIKLRMDLYKDCETLSHCVPRRKLRKAQDITHFNQNPCLQCFPFEEIVGLDWPE